MNISGRKIFVTWVVTMVSVTAIGGMIISGAPSKERARRIDQQRISDLQSISSAIDQIYTNQKDTKKLPNTLDELRQRSDVFVSSIIDPETNTPYTYRITGANSYQLCATFKTDGVDQAELSKSEGMYPKNGTDFWNHSVGEKCYSFTISK
ncbi:hypothetical protein IT408_01675 [Candidatus Uhrbacteria bacterium]|nr:hypothetical protein [Candidatus Uhrbacteria bacterium]